jgi:ASC-1-like (ASCH) protein
MDHLAIMSSKTDFLERILNGEKTIESRWYSTRRSPWDKVNAGDTIYFKLSGKPVSAKAKVINVAQYFDLEPDHVKQLLEKYESELGLNGRVSWFWQQVKFKKYVILMWLEDVEKVEPFEIDKTGFGMQSAWVSVENIEQIRV